MGVVSSGETGANMVSDLFMTTSASPPAPASPIAWLSNQPYLLLSLTSLFWAGNVVLARYVAGHVPPITLSCVRWCGTFFLLLPFAWPHLRRDWKVLVAHWPLMLIFSATGFAFNNVLSYTAMKYTTALNGLLMQSSGPLFVALWSLTLFGVRLDARPIARDRDLARRRADHHSFMATLPRADQHPPQQGRPMYAVLHVCVRLVLRADAAPAKNPPVVADRVYHRLRRADAGSVFGWELASGNADPHFRWPDLRDAVLCRDLPVGAGLSVLQPRRRFDRPQSRRAVRSI